MQRNLERECVRCGNWFAVITVWVSPSEMHGRHGIKKSSEVSRIGSFKQVRNLSHLSCHQVVEVVCEQRTMIQKILTQADIMDLVFFGERLMECYYFRAGTSFFQVIRQGRYVQISQPTSLEIKTSNTAPRTLRLVFKHRIV